MSARRSPVWVAVIALLLTGSPQGEQAVAPLNERAGLFTCSCPGGRGSGTIHVAAAALAWQRYDQLNAQMSALSARMSSCLAEAASGKKPNFGCSSLRSQEASLRAQAAGAMALAQTGAALAPAQCADRCRSSAPPPGPSASAAPPSNSSSAAPNVTGGLPVGNDWSLNDTISGLRPINGLSEIQRRWADETQKMLQAFKPIGPVKPDPPAAALPAAPATAPAAGEPPSVDPVTGFKLLRPASESPHVAAVAPPTHDTGSGVDPEVDRLIAEELTSGDAEVEEERARLARSLAPHVAANLSPGVIRELTNAMRAWELMPNKALNPARASLDAARLKALKELEARAETSPPDPGRDLRPFFRIESLFEKRVLPSLKVLNTREPAR